MRCASRSFEKVLRSTSWSVNTWANCPSSLDSRSCCNRGSGRNSEDWDRRMEEDEAECKEVEDDDGIMAGGVGVKPAPGEGDRDRDRDEDPGGRSIA